MVVDIKLPRPHNGQNAVLQSTARFKVLLCGRRWGKSLIAQVISILSTINGEHIAYVTPTYKLSNNFFPELIKLIPKQLIKSANKSDLSILLKTGGSISFLTGERLDNFRGRKFHRVIIDEAAHIPDLENAWLNSIRPTLTDYKGDALFISTPRGKNYFYTLFLKGQNKEDGFESFHYSTYDNPFIDSNEVDAAKKSIPESIFKQEYLAIPNANSNSVVALTHIEDNTITSLSSKPTVVYGIDVAKYTDYTVICGLSADGETTYFERFQKDNDYTEKRIKALPASIKKVIDGTHGSIGDGIYERLIRQGINNLTSFQFTAKSKPELITQMILDIEQGNLKFNKVTADELSIFEYSYSSTGYIKYGNASGGHDDTVIALALANKYRKQVPTNFMSSFDF